MLDPRFSLANERTFLAQLRTALALIAGGIAAAKALSFDDEVLRWLVALPPLIGGGVLAFDAPRRWRVYEDAMRAGEPRPAGRGLKAIGAITAAYAGVALVVSVLD